MAAPKITTGYTQPSTKLIVKPDIAKYTDKNGKVSAKYQTALTNFYANSSDPEAVKYRTDELTKKYGSLKNADGKPLFAPTYIKALAEGVEPPASLDKAVTDWATSKMEEATNYDWNNFSGGIGSVAAQNLLSSFVKDPSQVDSALTFKSSGVELTPEQKEANAKALEDKAAKAEKDTAALENYDPNAGTWDPSKNTVDTPFGNMLSGLVSGYKNPYAADYVNPLAAVEKPTLTNIKTPFTKNTIPQDLVNLFNSAGTDYAGGNNPQTKGTSLGSKLLKLYQPSTTDSSGQLAKPGAPDTASTTLPKITGDGTTVVNSNGSTAIGGGNVPTGEKPSTAIGGGNVPTGEKPSTPQYTAGDYIEPSTRAVFANNPALADQIAWSAAQDVAKQPKTEIVTPKTEVKRTPWEEEGITEDQYNSWQAENARIESERQAGIKALADKAAAEQKAINDARIAAEQKVAAERAALASQANLEASAQNAGYQGFLGDTAAMQDFLKSENASVYDYTGKYAEQPYVNYTSAPSSQQQLEDQAQNAGYQGFLGDTAAMQDYLNSLPPAVDTVKPVNTGIVTPDVTKFATTNNLNTNTGVGVNTLLGGNTQPVVTPKTEVKRTPWEEEGITEDQYNNWQAFNSTLVGPQVTVQPQPVVTQPSAGRNADVAINPNTGQTISGTRVKF